MLTVQNVYELLDTVVSFETQADFDNSGFLVGDRSAEVSGILFALDLTEKVIDEALEKGANLIVWEWEESKNSSGGVTEIKFMKKSVNLAQGTERIIMADRWVAKVGWTDFVDEYSGKYRMIEQKAPDYKGLERLRAFAKGYSTWVNRYSIES